MARAAQFSPRASNAYGPATSLFQMSTSLHNSLANRAQQAMQSFVNQRHRREQIANQNAQANRAMELGWANFGLDAATSVFDIFSFGGLGGGGGGGSGNLNVPDLQGGGGPQAWSQNAFGSDLDSLLTQMGGAQGVMF
jgi:hypothetical protein